MCPDRRKGRGRWGGRSGEVRREGGEGKVGGKRVGGKEKSSFKLILQYFGKKPILNFLCYIIM